METDGIIATDHLAQVGEYDYYKSSEGKYIHQRVSEYDPKLHLIMMLCWNSVEFWVPFSVPLLRLHYDRKMSYMLGLNLSII